MNLRTVGSTIALSILLTACATTYEDRAIKDKNYSGALYSVSYYEAKAGRDDVDKLVARIKDAAGSQYQLQFYEDTKNSSNIKKRIAPSSRIWSCIWPMLKEVDCWMRGKRQISTKFFIKNWRSKRS